MRVREGGRDGVFSFFKDAHILGEFVSVNDFEGWSFQNIIKIYGCFWGLFYFIHLF